MTNSVLTWSIPIHARLRVNVVLETEDPAYSNALAPLLAETVDVNFLQEAIRSSLWASMCWEATKIGVPIRTLSVVLEPPNE